MSAFKNLHFLGFFFNIASNKKTLTGEKLGGQAPFGPPGSYGPDNDSPETIAVKFKHSSAIRIRIGNT